MTLIEHLDELRSRIIKVGIAFFGVAIVAWFFRERIFEWLLDPAGPAQTVIFGQPFDAVLGTTV